MTFTRDEIKAATFDYAHAITDRSYTLDDMDEVTFACQSLKS
ncbi:hypothetical protein Ccr5_gp199c [Caulobacter phage Ccr5]|nr:hypothetical protein Ccr5_gp199c [Caulobacter phage Ccr5]